MLGTQTDRNASSPSRTPCSWVTYLGSQESTCCLLCLSPKMQYCLGGGGRLFLGGNLEEMTSVTDSNLKPGCMTPLTVSGKGNGFFKKN